MSHPYEILLRLTCCSLLLLAACVEAPQVQVDTDSTDLGFDHADPGFDFGGPLDSGSGLADAKTDDGGFDMSEPADTDYEDGMKPLSCLPLGSTNVRIPDPDRTGESLNRTGFDADLLPLQTEVDFLPAGPCRPLAPTTVRVVLDKIESIRPGIVTTNTSTQLGEPERVTLVEGDALEVFVWAGNDGAGATPVILGFGFGEIAMDDLLSNVVVGAAEGGGAVTGVVPGGPYFKGSHYYAQRLEEGQLGGIRVEGTVKPNPSGGPWQVDVSAAVAYSNQPLDSERVLDLAAAEMVYQNSGSDWAFHQQGQYYGGYSAEFSVASGDVRVVAAPGSWAYHGTDWKGQTDPMEKQAAYWVPLEISLKRPPANPASTLKIVPSITGPADPNAISITMQDAAGVRAYSPNQDIPFENDATLRIVFLGTSETAVSLRGM